MSTALQVTLILFLVALAGGLVPLLFQLRRTAKALDAFLIASRRDLGQITEDVHASRLRMDHLAVSLQASLDEISVFAQLMGEVGGMVRNFHNQFHSTIESASRNLGGILGGISAVLSFFKSPPTQQEPQ
jgi:hypothetical protein